MRPLHIYLIVYFLLVIGAGIALWQAGVVARVSPTALVFATSIVVGLGIFLALTSASVRRRT
jgi:hypothetical protein